MKAEHEDIKVTLGSGWKFKDSTFEYEDWPEDQKVQEQKKKNEFATFIGIDKGNYGQHYVRDLRRGLPFCDSSVDLIVADNVLEHIPPVDHFGMDDYIFVMNECARVLKIGGRMKIVVPYWSSMSFAKDPTHFRMFAEKSFSYMEEANAWDYGFEKVWKVLKSERGQNRSEIMYVELEKIKDVTNGRK